MKIAFLSIYSGIINRGVETFTLELSQRLANYGHEVTVFQTGERAVPNCQTITIRVALPTTFTSPNNLLSKFFLTEHQRKVFEFTLKIVSTLFREKFDIVLSQNGGWQTFLVRWVTWIYGGKLIVVGQAGLGWDDKWNLLNFPDCFVGFSNFQCGWAKKINPFVRVEKIYSGVDLKLFNPQGKSAHNALRKPIILSIGSFTPIKRLDLLIAAVSRLPRVSLLLIGDGPQKKLLSGLGKSLLGKNFLLRKASYNQLPDIYRSVDVFAFTTSPWESFGIVMLEAMATNLPIVVSDDPIRREVVGSAGLFADPNDPKNYAKALKKALSKKWGNIPRKRAEKFSWDKISLQYAKLFEGLISK